METLEEEKNVGEHEAGCSGRGLQMWGGQQRIDKADELLQTSPRNDDGRRECSFDVLKEQKLRTTSKQTYFYKRIVNYAIIHSNFTYIQQL